MPTRCPLLVASLDVLCSITPTDSGKSPTGSLNCFRFALLLAVAGHLKVNPPERTIRVVFFVNEESPFSFGIQMGSNVYAKRCKARQDRIVAMIAVVELEPTFHGNCAVLLRDGTRLTLSRRYRSRLRRVLGNAI